MMSELIKMSLFCDSDMLDELSLDTQTDERTSSLHDPFTLEQSMTSCHERSSVSLSAISRFLETIASARIDLGTLIYAHPDQIFGNDYLQSITQTVKSENAETTHAAMPAAKKVTKKSDVTVKPDVTNETNVTVNPEVTNGRNITVTPEANKKRDVTVKPEVTKTERLRRFRAIAIQTSRYGYRIEGLEIERPPYSYRALVCAAIFLSGQEEVSRNQIIAGIRDMFEVYRIDQPEWQTRWQKNVLNKGFPWEKDILVRRARHFRLKYERLDLGIFKRSKTKDSEDTDDLFTQIGCPEKYEELRMRVEMAKKETGQSAKSKVKATSTPEDQPPSKAAKKVASLRQPSPDVTEEKTSLAKPVTSPEVMEKCPSLRLPPRPCFNDDSSNDSLQLSAKATCNDNAHVPAPMTTLPAFGATFSTQIPYFTPTAFVYGVPYVSVPQFVPGSFL